MKKSGKCWIKRTLWKDTGGGTGTSAGSTPAAAKEDGMHDVLLVALGVFLCVAAIAVVVILTYIFLNWWEYDREEWLRKRKKKGGK